VTTINDGGPAFPSDEEGGNIQFPYHMTGMTLRQWYAGMALQGILASPVWMRNIEITKGITAEKVKELVAALAHGQADAMLAHEAKELEAKP